MVQAVGAYKSSDGSLFENFDDAQRHEKKSEIEVKIKQFVRTHGNRPAFEDADVISATDIIDNLDELLDILLISREES